MKRLLAFVVAIGLVAGAAAIRSSRDGGGSSASPSRGPLRLVCASDLVAACAQVAGDLGVTAKSEPAATTANNLESVPGPDAGLDAWVVTAPWPAIVDDARDAKGLPRLFDGGKRTIVARPKLALVVRADRAAVLKARPECKAIDWLCLGKIAAVPSGWVGLGGKPEWGPVKVGIPSVDSAIGLAVLGQAVGEFFGAKALSSTDLDDDGFVTWLTALAHSVPPVTTAAPITAIVTAAGTYDAAGGIDKDADPLSINQSVTVLYPAPVVTVDVVVAGVKGGAKVGRVTTTADVAQAPLPPSGFLDALRDRWKQVSA